MNITYSCTCEPEDLSVRGNAFDRETEDRILLDLETNPWAWCTIKVTATIRWEGATFEGVSYLGGCSYESKDAFEADAYYSDMKLDARADLVRNLAEAVRRGETANKALRELYAMDASLNDLVETTAHD